MAFGNPFAALGVEFYGFLLPWIFTFAIVYGLLTKAKIFGDVNRQVSIALAFVLAFFVTAAGGPQLADFFVNLFGGASAFLAGILVVILFVAMLGYGKPGEFKHWAALAAVIIIGALLFVVSSGAFGGYVAISGDMASLIFWIIIIVVAIYMVTKERKEAPAGGGDKK